MMLPPFCPGKSGTLFSWCATDAFQLDPRLSFLKRRIGRPPLSGFFSKFVKGLLFSLVMITDKGPETAEASLLLNTNGF